MNQIGKKNENFADISLTSSLLHSVVPYMRLLPQVSTHAVLCIEPLLSLNVQYLESTALDTQSYSVIRQKSIESYSLWWYLRSNCLLLS